MTLDNSKTIISFRIKLFVATVLFLAYIVLAYVAKVIRFPLFGISDTAWTLFFVVIYLFIVFLPMLLNYQYVFYSDDGEKIIIRYFNAGIVGGRKNSIEIHKRAFAGYKTETKLFGLNISLILFQKVNTGTAKYPPVYISALPREQRVKVFKSLNQYIPRV